MKLQVNNDCILCSFCSQACSVSAPFFDGEKITIDNEKCIGCGKCMEACYLGAIYDVDNLAEPAEAHEPVHLYCDALIIGGGAAGLIAAVKVAELTGKKVIVLEKGKKAGSCAPYATGIRIFDTRWEKDAGMPSQVDGYIKAAMNTTRWELNPKLVSNTFHALPRFFDWICEWANPEDTFALLPSPFDQKISVNLKSNLRGAGQFIISRFTRRCGELGVDICREYTAKDFIMGEDGQINGVVASDPGGETIVHCRTCLIATGSLINSEILGRVIPDYADAFTRRYGHRLPTLTGDGVEMAERAGIPIDYGSICIAHLGPLCLPCDMQSIHFGKPIPADMLAHIHRGEALRVNMNGQRWINEAFGGDTSWCLLKQPQCISWTILDSKLMAMQPLPDAVTLIDPDKGRMLNNAIPDSAHAPDPRAVVGNGTPGFLEKKPFDIETFRYFAKLPGKHLIIADTLEELAEGMGVPTDAFIATVKRYNELCAKGVDEDFCKDAEHLLPIGEGPFYALHTFLASDGAFGGLAIDENMQVQGKNGPVTGLYAAGDNTAGRYVNLGGDKYQITNDLTWAVASGFIAGERMALELGLY